MPQHVAQGHVVRHREANAPLQALAFQRFIHPAMPRACCNHPHVAGGGKVGQRQAGRSGQRVPFAHEAHIRLAKQRLLEKTRLQLRQQAQRQVGAARRHVGPQAGAGHGHHLEGDTRGCLGQRVHQHRQEVHLAHIGHGQGEAAFAGGWVKRGAHIERLLQPIERGGHRLGQLQGVRRGGHAVLGAQKQLVAQAGAQATQCAADGGLAHAQHRGHGRDALFAQQVVKHQQQVEVESGEFHGAVLFEIRIMIIFEFRFTEFEGGDMMCIKTCGRSPLRPKACNAQALIREQGLAPATSI